MGSEPAVAGEVTCFRFVNGTTTWLDIAYAVTTGQAPSLAASSLDSNPRESQLQLGDIMGCQNRIMLQIARIAAWHQQNGLAVKEGRLSCPEINQDVSDIVVEVQRYLAEGAFECLQISTRNPAGVTQHPKTLITRVFAQMALVYLHLVAYGFRNLDLSGAAISGSN